MTWGGRVPGFPFAAPVLLSAALLFSCATGVDAPLGFVRGDSGAEAAGGGVTGEGGASGKAGAAGKAGSSGKGGSSSGGSDNGGSSNGGSSNGGSSNGGSSNGGSSNGGSSNGGSSNGGSSNGGSSNGGSSGSSGGSGGSSGGTYPGCELTSSDTACNDCLHSSCGQQCATCSANDECLYLLDCIGYCYDDYCVEECELMYSGGVDDLVALLGATSGCISLQCSAECSD